MSNVTALPKSDIITLCQGLLSDARAGRLEGLIVVGEYANGVVTDDIAGVFDVDRKYSVMGKLEECRDRVKKIDTEEYDYD